MHVGVYLGFARGRNESRPLVELYQQAFRHAVESEQLGFDFVMASEHHFKDDQWNPAPLLLLAGVARETSVIRLGTNIVLTPFYNPVRLAEDMAVLDLMSNGRLALLVPGSASITREFETFGIPPEERFGRVWETLAILRKCFSHEPFDHHGRYFNFPNVHLTSTTVQKPLPLWFGGFGPKMTVRAAREGYHYYGPNIDIYIDELRKAGRNPDEFNMGFRGSFTVVATEKEVPEARERALAAAAAHNAEYNESGRDLAFQYISSTARRSDPIVGTPDQVLAALEKRFKGSMFTHYELRGEGEVLELIAKEMLPTLRSWGRKPIESARSK